MAGGVRKRAQHGVTERQAAFLAFVEGYVDECGIAPTYDEIASGLRLSSKSGVHRIARALSNRGRLRMKKGLPRSMVVVAAPVQPVEEPKPNRLPDAWLNQPVTVRLPPKLNASLQALARRTRMHADEIVAEALSDFLLEQPE